MQPILNGDAQFTMLVSLLLFILTYCMFMNRLIDRKREISDPDTKRIAERQLFLLTTATSILFISLGVCLARIIVVLLGSSSSSCLPRLDCTVISTFCIAVGVSIGIFIDAYWLRYIRK